MLRNYLTIAFRTLRKQPGYSFINIAGLGLGLAAAVLILLYVQDERRADAFHEQGDQIYQLGLTGRVGEQYLRLGNTGTPMGPAMVADFPEVVQAARVKPWGRTLMEHGAQRFYEDEFYYADSTFFDLFTYRVLAGDPSRALAQPQTLVLSASAAQRYFGAADAVGASITVDTGTEYTVGAVVEDAPGATHFPFDILGSFISVEDQLSPIWLSNHLYTYVLLRDGATQADLDAKLPLLVDTYVAPEFEQYVGITIEEARAAGQGIGYYSQPLSDLYLRFDGEAPIGPTSDVQYVYILGGIALFILLLACINFMNLATARSAKRAKEVGLRKVMGSNRPQLIRQFLGESLLMVALALVVAAVLIVIALPLFNTLAGKTLALTGTDGVLAGGLLLAIALVTGLTAGIYPAFVLSSFQPAAVLKGTVVGGRRAAAFRSTLVVVQFAVSVGLIVGTGVVFQQLRFMQSERLGFAGEQAMILPIQSDEARTRAEGFRQTLLNHPGIEEVAVSDFVPGRTNNTTAFRPGGATSNETYVMEIGLVSHEFTQTLGLDLATGRTFDRDRSTDADDAMLINEAAAREMGWTADEALGQRIHLLGDDDQAWTVVGVLEDFHFESLHRAIRPLSLIIAPDRAQNLTVRIRPERMQETVAFIEEQWASFEPTYPYRYVFLDEDFGRFYRQEQRLAQVFTAFTVLALIIACLGLFGMASFMAQARTKEIGVRKVLGATVPGIVLLLSKEFTKLVGIALLIALPVAAFGMNRWLENFAYQTDLSPWLFVGAAVGTLLVAWLTVSYQSIRAAIINPVRALRYE